MADVDEFLRNLEKSNLLNAEQWAVVRREFVAAKNVHRDSPRAPAAGESFTPRDLAARLVERGFLTRWQADMLLAGKKAFFLGKYRLLDCIGTGGMGAVFKALHGDLGRTVAIKILSAEVMKSRQAVARFRHEIQAVAALDDPHIVAAYDAGNERGANYLVMEFVEGHDLGHLVKHNSPLPIDWACECIRQAALGLQHAHEQGLVHRDIKPTNLLVTRDHEGHPLTKILDLGLARFVSEMVPPDRIDTAAENDDDDGSLTQIGQFLGTPDYIAPEQAHDTRTADIRSDIFSLGCTLFRLLTGELPFIGDSVLQKLEARETTDARRVRSIRSDVPAELDAVVARMLARNPRGRYQAPRDVAQALAPFTIQGSESARTVAVVAPPPRSQVHTETENERLEQIFRSLATEAAQETLSVAAIASRLKRTSPLVGIAAGVIVIVGLAGYLYWQRISTATLVVEWPLTERDGGALFVGGRTIKLPEKQQTFTVSGRAGAWELRLQRDGYEPIEDTKTLGRGERVDFSPHWRATPATARQSELAALERRFASTKEANVLSDEATAMRRVLLAFARRHVGSRESAAASELLTTLRWPLDLVDGSAVPAQERQQFAQNAGDTSAAELVGMLGESRLRFWNAVVAVATSSDRRLFAGASLDGTVQVFDAADGRRMHTIAPSVMPADLAFSPVSDVLAVAGHSGPVVLWNASSGMQIAVLPDTAAPIAFSADGKLIAGRAARQEIALWDAQTGELRRTMQGHATGELRGMSFSHNGKMLASSGSDMSVLLWDVASGQERRRFPSSQHPRFSLDDAYLAAGTATGDLVLWDTRTGETQRTFDEGGYPLDFRPGGQTIVSKRLGRAVLWNLESGEEIRTIVDVPELAAVSPDGAWLGAGDAAVGELRIWNLNAGAGTHVINMAGPVAALAFTADSTAVVTGSNNGILQIWSAETGAERIATAPPLGPADLSPDGRQLAVRQGDRIDLIEVTTGQSVQTMASSISELDALSFSPDGRLLAGFGGWGFFRTSLRLWDASEAREVPLPENISGTVRTIGFSADSQLLAVAGDSRLVTVWNVARKTVRYDLDDCTDRVTALAFHPDGRRLAVACQDKSVLVWDLKSGKGQPLASPGAVCHQLAFSSDGNHLAAPAGERVVLWTIDGGKIVAELVTGGSDPVSIAWHPSGKSLAAAGHEGRVWLWNDPHARRYRDEPDRAIPIGPAHGIVQRVLWSPEGRHLITVNGNGTINVLRLVP